MPKCGQCGASNVLLMVSKEGFCRPCQIENLIAEQRDFTVSKTFYVFLPGNYVFFVAVDDIRGRFALCAQKMGRELKVSYHRYADLIDFEVSENETPKNMCNAMMMDIYLNSLECPHISFYLVNSSVQFGSKAYHRAVRTAKNIHGMLTFIKHNAKAAPQEPAVPKAAKGRKPALPEREARIDAGESPAGKPAAAVSAEPRSAPGGDSGPAAADVSPPGGEIRVGGKGVAGVAEAVKGKLGGLFARLRASSVPAESAAEASVRKTADEPPE